MENEQKKVVTLHLKIGDGHRFRPKSSGQKRQALFPSCESYGQVCTRDSEDALLSAHVRIRRSYVTDMLSIYDSYIFAENIMTKI